MEIRGKDGGIMERVDTGKKIPNPSSPGPGVLAMVRGEGRKAKARARTLVGLEVM